MATQGEKQRKKTYSQYKHNKVDEKYITHVQDSPVTLQTNVISITITTIAIHSSGHYQKHLKIEMANTVTPSPRSHAGCLGSRAYLAPRMPQKCPEIRGNTRGGPSQNFVA